MLLPKCTAIAACDEAGVIGKEGKIPWYLPEDLEHFYRSTEGQVIVMGHTTFLSLPARAFVNRICLVFTKKHKIDLSRGISIDSLVDLEKYYGAHPELFAKKNFVIGGSSIFSLFFREHLIDEAVITQIHGRYEGDAYFPMHYLASWHKKLLRSNEEFSINIYRKEKNCGD